MMFTQIVRAISLIAIFFSASAMPLFLVAGDYGYVVTAIFNIVLYTYLFRNWGKTSA